MKIIGFILAIIAGVLSVKFAGLKGLIPVIIAQIGVLTVLSSN